MDAQGGDVTEENTETDEDGDTSYARLVIRVPSSKFSASMEALEKAGVLRSSTRGSDDVTTEVIDTGVRVRAQEASLKRVELLLAEAKSLKDIIWIESQLTSRQAELDSLKSQQSWLKDQTSLSTITVDISTQPAKAKEKKDDDDPGRVPDRPPGRDEGHGSRVRGARDDPRGDAPLRGGRPRAGGSDLVGRPAPQGQPAGSGDSRPVDARTLPRRCDGRRRTPTSGPRAMSARLPRQTATSVS